MSVLDEIDFTSHMTKMELLEALKREAKSVHINDIMQATVFLREDSQYIQAGYREDYIKNFSKAFFARIKDIKEDNNQYEGSVDTDKLREFLEVIRKQGEEAHGDKELCFLRIARIVATYTTFIREESVHPVGTRFPGGFQLRYENGKYLCPVKERQKNNPSALCRFCVSVQDDEV
jgi:uncharacterized protein (UPF0305 family)